MNLEVESKEKLINLVKYYKSELENVSRDLEQRNKEVANLKKEITKLREEKEELKGENNNNIQLLW